ncbi:site-specific integrase [uncultured Enterococcus sp.]|uniref:site-specific integrase n=1 Tax=uncultured Enterococcus sp. TaxID=167972 RepID=UPI002AA7A450|nr:site-specific integrase [uncultured Enterococcus sp.]
MATIKKYVKADGSQAYMFQAYLGVDSLTGKKKRTTRRGFRTAKEAKLALAQLQLEVDKQGFVKQNYSTFKELYELWYAQYKNTVKSISAERTKGLFENHILPVFGKMKLNKISINTCQNAVNKWSNELKQFSKLKTYTQQIFDFAIRQKIIQENPMRLIIIPKVQPSSSEFDEKEKFLDKEQLKTFLTKAKKELQFNEYLIFRVLAFTGIRKGELYSLTWSDLDLKQSTLSISKTSAYTNKQYIISTPKTKQSQRLLSLDAITVNELKMWKKQQKEWLFSYGERQKNINKQLIFCRPNGSVYDHKKINYLLNELDTNITPHSFRHTHASLLFESGATIKEVQLRLGHSNVKTTLDIYTHVTKNAEKESINKLANYLNF